MISEIKYKGISATPSDYECLDGELAAAVGLVPEDGALNPIAPPKTLFTLSAGQRVVVLHTTSVFTHYIIQDEANNLFWRTLDDATLRSVAALGDVIIHQITTIGNTIVALCENGIHYMLWSADNQSYVYLGNKIPECPISFGLNGESRHFADLNDEEGADFLITYDTINGSDIYDEFTEDNKRKITSQVLAKVNKFITQVSTDDERFIYPFFVRYAYRLYDGSLIHHSAPILMLPCTRANPVVVAKNIDDGTASSGTRCDIYAVAAKLDYLPLMTEQQREHLALWGDVIKSVDIFISAPIYTYDQSGECESFAKKRSVHGYIGYPSYFVGKFNTNKVVDANWDTLMQKYYQRWDINQLYFHDNPYNNMGPIVRLPEYDKSEIESKIKNCSSFYFLTSVEIDHLPPSRTDVEIEKGALKSLVAREAMTDDYQTHDTFAPKYAFNYNSRLNIANVERHLFEGFDLASMCCYTNGGVRFLHESGVKPTAFSEEGTMQYIVQTDVQTPNGEKHLVRTSSIPLKDGLSEFYYLYYPDVIAKRLRLKPVSSVQGGTTVMLEPHTMLNGAVFFNGFDINRYLGRNTTILPADDAIIALPNKIYTSEVNNPFYFPLLSINTVGSGTIIGLSSAAKALSEGQFGQFPLYAFATDGVWALEVSSTGTYSARQPLSRDVCISAESITQIDSSVLFATERGIMLLAGSQSICISDILNSDRPFRLDILPHGKQLLTDFAKFPIENVSYIPFEEFIKESRMLYDYVHQRILLFNPKHTYAYVYSLESKAWGMITSALKSGVNAYPNALAMDANNSLVDLSQTVGTSGYPMFLVTRPIKIEADILKTIDTIMQRGYFKKGHIKMALYGSRNLFDWFFISSSTNHILRGYRGTAYKYFRIVVLGALDAGESIAGATIQYTPRQTNQLR